MLAARATELEREFPYGVVRQLLEPALAEAGAGERAALFAGAAAGARPVFGAERIDLAEPGSPFAILYGLYWLTANLSQGGPLLVTVDDAHWADTPSLQFLRFLVPRLEGLPIVVAIGTRPTGAGGPVAPIGTDAETLVVSPGPLGEDSVAKLLAQALGLAPERAFTHACHEVTGGNPFLLTELARKLASESVEPNDAGVPLVRGLVPEAILRSVLQRVASLEPSALALARAVAVLGDGCDQRRAAALAEIGDDAAADAADALRAADIVEREPPLRFTHPLVRNAIYTDIPAGARSREHERAAELLRAEGLSAERIASHLLATEPRGDARVTETLFAAARVALDQGAPEPAIAYLRRAMREPPPAGARADVLELLSAAGLRAADTSAVAPFQDEALERLTAEPERLIRSAEGLGKLLLAQGRIEEAARILDRGAAAADAAGDMETAVALDAQLIDYTQLPPDTGRVRLARYDGRLAPGSAEARVVNSMRAWWLMLGGGHVSEAAPLAKLALEGEWIAAGRHDPAAWANPVLVLIRADELSDAEEAIESMIASATERGAAGSLATALFMRGGAALRRGDLQRAEADARQIEDLRCSGLSGFFAIVGQLFASLLLDVLIERHELDEADRELTSRGVDGELSQSYWMWPLLFSRGRLRVAQGRAEEGARDLLDLVNRMDVWGAPTGAGVATRAHAARALAAGGEVDAALSLAEDQLPRARRWGAPSCVAEALAMLGVAVGGERGIGLVEEAVDILEAAPTRLPHAAALTDLGALLRRERRPVEAREPLRAALAIARRCGGVRVARRAAHELEAAGEKVQRYTPIGADALTASERRVAEMAARGMTNREIAACLYVTVKTVESHLSATYDKLGGRVRTELKHALDPESLSAAS